MFNSTELVHTLNNFRTTYLHTETLSQEAYLLHTIYNDIDIFLGSNDEKILYSVVSRRVLDFSGTWNNAEFVMCTQPIFWVNSNNYKRNVQTYSHASKPVLLSYACHMPIYTYNSVS